MAFITTYPAAQISGNNARWRLRCAGHTFENEGFGACFSDAIPILEMMGLLLFPLIIWVFASFSFSMFAPPSRYRTYKWRLANAEGGDAYFPMFQIGALLGIAWCGWNLIDLPLETAEIWVLLYWVFWAFWFAAGALVSWPVGSKGGEA